MTLKLFSRWLSEEPTTPRGQQEVEVYAHKWWNRDRFVIQPDCIAEGINQDVLVRRPHDRTIQ